MISMLKLKDIETEIFTRTALIAIPGLSELFDLSDTYTPQQIMYSLVKRALRKWETYNPLYLSLRVYIQPDSNKKFKFVDNFTSYITGVITEDQVALVPSSIVGISFARTLIMSPAVRSFKYVPPYLYGFYYAAGSYWVNGLYKYPMIEEYVVTSKIYTDRCGIYYLSGYNESDSTYVKLLDQIYVEVGNYLISLKKNLNLADMPLELFTALEEDVTKTRSDLETYYSNTQTSGHYLM